MMGSYGQNVPEFFVKYRARGGLSQADLARLLKVTPQYICNVENGRNQRPVRLAQRLMKFLDVRAQNHFDELMRDSVWQYAEDKIKLRRKNAKAKAHGRGTK